MSTSLEKTGYLAETLSKSGFNDTNAMFGKFASLLGKALKVEGNSATAAALNALVTPMPGLLVTITTGGTLTLGTLSVSTNDTVYFNGLIWVKAQWVQNVAPTAAFTADATLAAAASGMLYLIGADAKTATLPSSAAVGAGIKYAFLNAGADGAYGFTVSPNAVDKLMGSFNNGKVLITMSGTDNKDIVNTKATAKRGDYIVVESDGVDGWYVVDGIGIWTEESQLVKNEVPRTVEIKTDNYAVLAGDSGKIFGMGTDAKVFSLPATVAGLKYTFVNTGAAGNNILTISPVAADGISGTITLAQSVVVDAGVVNKDLINTKASSQAGDNVTLIGTGVTGTTAWIIVSSTGIWAAEG